MKKFQKIATSFNRVPLILNVFFCIKTFFRIEFKKTNLMKGGNKRQE